MSSKALVFVFVLLAQATLAQKADSFQAFYESNFEVWSEPFSTQAVFAKYKLKIDSSNIFSFSKNLYLEKYFASRKKLSKSNYLQGQIYPIYYSRADTVVVLVYDVFSNDEHGNQQFKTVFHQFSMSGSSIDSLVVSEIADYEGTSVRIFADFSTPLSFSVNTNLLLAYENSTGVLITKSRKSSFKFSITESRILVENQKPYAFNSVFGLYTFDHILNEFTADCFKAKQIFLHDVNHDMLQDFVALIETTNKCKDKTMDIVVSISDRKGIYDYTGLQANIPSDVAKQLFEMQKVGPYIVLKFSINGFSSDLYYTYSSKKDILFLRKAIVSSEGKSVTHSDLDIPFQKSFDFARVEKQKN